MAIVAVVVAVPVTLLARGDDSEPEPVAVTSAPSGPELEKRRSDRGLRVAYRVPEGWRASKSDRTLRLRSRDGSALIAVAAPAGSGRAADVRRDLLDGIRSSYRRVDVERGEDREVGGIEARTAVVSARQADGGPLRILVAVADGDDRTYVVEVFTAASAKPQRLRQAQAALNALRLRG